MTSILVMKGKSPRKQFNSNYLKNQKHLFNFLFCFWNLNQILNIFKTKKQKKLEVHSSTISDIIGSKRTSYLNVLKAIF